MQNLSYCVTPVWNIMDALQAPQIIKIPPYYLKYISERHIHDKRVNEIKMQFAASNPYMEDSNRASEKFKVLFCEKLGITLDKYFTSHYFEKDNVICEKENIMNCKLSL